MSVINLHLGDGEKALEGMHDKQYSLVIVDPPYGIGESSNNNASRSKLTKAKDYGNKKWDDDSPKQEYFNQLIRISENQIIWGANHFISKIPIDSPAWVVWNKNNGANDFADCELAFTSFNKAVRKIDLTWHGMRQHDMKNKEIRIHPTQKPVALYKWLLHNYAKEGDTILDTHGGSMSIAIACGEMGFDLDLWELDEEYFELGANRVIKHFNQLNAFTTKPQINVIR